MLWPARHAAEARAPLQAALTSLGYPYLDLGDFDRVCPFFAKPRDWSATHHVHRCIAGGDQELRHVAFRDSLRASPESVRAYEALEHPPASEHHDRILTSCEAYSLAKSIFIDAALKGASLPLSLFLSSRSNSDRQS